MFRPKTKTIFKILFAPLLWLFQACSPLGNPVDEEKSDSHYYNNSKSQIRYSPMGNWFELGNSPMNADVESFEVFSKWLSRDKDQIFIEAYAIKNMNIDLNSFRVKNEDYMTNIGFDKDFVYVFDKVQEDTGHDYKGFAEIIKDANPKTYTRTDWNWGNDGTSYFYNSTKLDADFESFEVINDYFSKDKHRIFSRTEEEYKPIAALVASFRILDEEYPHGIDELQVYWKPFYENKSKGLINIPYQNIEDVVILNWYFLRVDNTIFYDGIARTDIDNKSFEIIDQYYAKDSKYVYFKSDIVQGADPVSFKQMENSYKYSDKNGVYYQGKLEN